MRNQKILKAEAVREQLQAGKLSYDDAISHPDLVAYEEYFNKVGKQIAKKHGKQFKPFNKQSFLR